MCVCVLVYRHNFAHLHLRPQIASSRISDPEKRFQDCTSERIGPLAETTITIASAPSALQIASPFVRRLYFGFPLNASPRKMGKKTTKATRKFAASGQLKKTIQQRRKQQDVKRKVERRKESKKSRERRESSGVEKPRLEYDEEVEDVDSGFAANFLYRIYTYMPLGSKR